MADQIIPEKPKLFQPPIQKKPVQPVQPMQPARIRRPVQPVKAARAPEEETPVFNIPQTFQAQQPLPIMQPTPEKKSSWKRWIIILAVIIIISGLGYYFLSG